MAKPKAQIRIILADDHHIVRAGITGFQMPKSPTDFAPGGHFGLLGMRERADLIGARLEVQTEAGRGTRLSVRLPLSSDKT